MPRLWDPRTARTLPGKEAAANPTIHLRATAARCFPGARGRRSPASFLGLLLRVPPLPNTCARTHQTSDTRTHHIHTPHHTPHRHACPACVTHMHSHKHAPCTHITIHRDTDTQHTHAQSHKYTQMRANAHTTHSILVRSDFNFYTIVGVRGVLKMLATPLRVIPTMRQIVQLIFVSYIT